MIKMMKNGRGGHMEEENKIEFYTKQLRSYYKEVLVYFIILIAIIWGLPSWISMIAWGLLLIERGEHFKFFDKIWEKIGKYRG